MAEDRAETRKDNLRSGTPLWLKLPHANLRAEKQLPQERFDVIVVGTGISGALAAEALSQAGKSVLMVDRRPPVKGSTPASTAMIQHEIDVPLTRLRKKIGIEQADRAWLRSVKAVEDLVALTKKLKIDCDMRAKPALYLAGDDLGARALDLEAKARNSIGIEAEYLSHQELLSRYGIDRPAAIQSPASASANPAQLTTGLLEVVQARGGKIVAPIEITDMAELPGGVALATATGQVLVAEHAVFCTGYEHLPQMRSKAHRVTSTWAIASPPISDLPAWLHDTIVWEASDPYLYFRTDEENRVIAGGEDEESSNSNEDPEKLAEKARLISGKFYALTGVRIRKPAYRWSAPFTVTDTGLPMIDRVPGYERIHSVMGFGGNGITFSMIGAQIIAAALTGKTDPDADLFGFH